MNRVHDLKHADITEKIIGCAMRVHSYFGPGFQEKIYQRTLVIELNKIQLPVESEVIKTVTYEGITVGKRRIDLIIDDKVLVELKALTEIDKACYNQVLNCLKVFDLEVGLLLNFGKDKLQYKRFVN